MRRFVLKVMGWGLIGAGLLIGNLSGCTFQPHPTTLLQTLFATPTPTILPTPTPTPAPTQFPTPTPLPTPTPTPGPTISDVSGSLLPYLSHYFGSPVTAFVSDREMNYKNLVFPAGSTLVAYGPFVYGDKQRVVVSDGEYAGIFNLSDLPKPVREQVAGAEAHEMGLTPLVESLNKALAWQIYMDPESHLGLETITLELKAANGKTEKLRIDMERFIDDWEYARPILEKIYREYNIVHGSSKPNPNGWNEAQHIRDIWLGMRMLYYYTNFNPDKSMFGYDMVKNLICCPYHITFDPNRSSISIGAMSFLLPLIDEDGAHTNVDIFLSLNSPHGDGYHVFNPFTADVRPRVASVLIWDDINGSPTCGGFVIETTDPETGRKLYWEFGHLGVGSSGVWEEVLAQVRQKYGGVRRGFFRVNVPLNEGEFLSDLTDPDLDPRSNGYHIQFGQSFVAGFNRKYKILNPYTAAMQVYFMTHQADNCRAMWASPQGEARGFWMGDNHVASYTPSTPPVAYQDPVTGAVYHGHVGGKPEPGWKQQLPPYLRKSRHPRSAFRQKASLKPNPHI